MLSTVAKNAEPTESNTAGKDTKKWLGTYNHRDQWVAEWRLMADMLVAQCLTEKHGISGQKEPRGWTLYLITYGV